MLFIYCFVRPIVKDVVNDADRSGLRALTDYSVTMLGRLCMIPQQAVKGTSCSRNSLLML